MNRAQMLEWAATPGLVAIKMAQDSLNDAVAALGTMTMKRR